jgi:hypothetical protein
MPFLPINTAHLVLFDKDLKIIVRNNVYDNP